MSTKRSSTSSADSLSSQSSANISTKSAAIPSGVISDDNRLNVWIACLNISYDENKPFETLYHDDMDTVPNLRKIVDSAADVADRFDTYEYTKASIRLEIIQIISYYCAETQKKFDPLDGWQDLLEPLMFLKGSEVLKYKIFKTILQRYIPRGDEYDAIVRFLLVYHDPQLYMFLKSKQLTLLDYPYYWINRLFTLFTRPPAIFEVWDRYFIEKNRFLIFFLSTALIITFRDKILNYTHEVEDISKASEWELSITINTENLSAIFDLADSLKMKTPVSFIERLRPSLFDDKEEDSSLFDTLCWSVTVKELLKSMEKTSILSLASKNIKFFIVDCRSQEDFDAGHLPTAYHLDYSLRVSNPMKFSDSIENLVDLQTQLFKNDIQTKHFCIIDSGREEHRKYTDMVIRSCQIRNIKYVNLLAGGYKALHEHVGNKVDNIFISHDTERCTVCKDNAPSVTTNRLEKLKSQGQEFVERLKTSISLNNLSEEFPGPSRMVTSKSMYENPRTSISKWLEDPNLIMHFKCRELDSLNKHFDCELVFTRDHLIALRKIPDREDAAEISVKRLLTSIISITVKKNYKNIIVIKYNETSKADDLVVDNVSQFLFPDSAKAMRFFSSEHFRTLLIPYTSKK